MKMRMKAAATAVRTHWRVTLFVLVITGGALLFISTLIFRTNSTAFGLQLRTVQQERHAVTNLVHQLPNPDAILPGERDSVLAFTIGQLEELALKAETLPQPPHRIRLQLSFGLASKEARDVRKLYSDLKAYDDRLMRHLTHHASTLTILQPLLEYNPRADLMAEELSNTDIDERITEATAGLAAIQQNLNAVAAPGSDGSFDELSGYVASLQAQLESFQASRNKDRWYEDVNEAQRLLIANRHTYWENFLDQHQRNFTQVNRQLVDTLSRLN